MSGGSLHDTGRRAAAERLVDFHERFAPLFPRSRQDHAHDCAHDYLKGLMVCPERKSVEPIALLVGHGDVSGLQKFVGAAPWAYDDVMAERRRCLQKSRPLGGRLADRDRRGDRRLGLHQAGVALRRGGAAAQRPARQGGQLPGRRLPHRGDPGRAGPTRPSAVLARSDARGGARGEGAAGGGPHPQGRDLPYQAADRGRVSQERRGARPGRTGLGSRRLGVRPGGSPPRRTGTLLEQRYVLEIPKTWVFWTADPAGSVPEYSGRGLEADPPRRGSRRAPWSRSPTHCPPRRGWRFRCGRGRWGRWCSSSRRSGSGASGTASRGHRAGLIRRSAGAQARAEVLRLERRRGDATVEAGPCGLHEMPGGGISGRQQELPRNDAVRDEVMNGVVRPS